MPGKFKMKGRLKFRIRSIYNIAASVATVAGRRITSGPRVRSWPFGFEMVTELARRQLAYGINLPVTDSREYFNAVEIHDSVEERITTGEAIEPVKGRWFRSPGATMTCLYMHGGAFLYYPYFCVSMIYQVTDAIKANSFAPDYRLAPEHSLYDGIDDCVTAYKWLLDNGHAPDNILFCGDSAGGTMVPNVLRAARKTGLPMPAGAVCISPWVDLSNSGASMTTNEPTDMMGKAVWDRWAELAAPDTDLKNPDISPLYADFIGFPPLYIQAGGCEVLIDQIKEYAANGRAAGANVTLDIWPDMNHNFQSLGEMNPDSLEALSKIKDFAHRIAAP